MEKQRRIDMETQPLQIGLADRTIEIHPLYHEVQKLCRGYVLPNYSVPDLVIKTTQEDIIREDAAVDRNDIRISETQYPYLETLAVYRKIATEMEKFDTFMMHGSVISTSGQGYMITASSGVGKTTRTKLWIDEIPDSIVVNGDKPLLRVADEAVYACGTPWCGKEGWNTNISVPLRAIFILERSESGNSVEEISFGEAFPVLLRQTYRPENMEARRKTLHLIQELAGKVKVFRFYSEPTRKAVRMAWEKARGES